MGGLGEGACLGAGAGRPKRSSEPKRSAPSSGTGAAATGGFLGLTAAGTVVVSTSSRVESAGGKRVVVGRGEDVLEGVARDGGSTAGLRVSPTLEAVAPSAGSSSLCSSSQRWAAWCLAALVWGRRRTDPLVRP